MTKVWMICLLAGMIAFQANAQLKSRDFHFYVGGMATPQMALILNQNNYGYAELDYRAKMGLQLGVKAGIEYKLKNQLEGNIVWSTLGQSYRDMIRGRINDKVVELDYVSVAILYKRVFGFLEEWIDKSGKSNWFAFAGIQPGRLLAARTTWRKDGMDQDMITYLTEENNNPNNEILYERGIPDSDNELFETMDMMAIFGVGLQYWITPYTSIHAEWRNGIGLKDINAEAWRIPNRLGIYEPSFNAFTGINISVQLYY